MQFPDTSPFDLDASQSIEKPTISADQNLPEITVKAVVLSVFLTIILGAANAFLGLKVGTTVSASIPAAILSMGILRFFRESNVLENNMVQTAASAGECLASGIIFTLPALLVLGVWTQFDFFTTAAIAFIGGTFGVLFSIPLRRVMLSNPALRFPEGTAIGKVLQASTDATTSLKKLIMGALVGGGISLAQTGFGIFADAMQWWTTTASGTLVGFGLGCSPALIAAGYIVGLEVAISSLVGVLIGWFIGIPIMSHLHPQVGVAAADAANAFWHNNSRYIGVGIMFVGGMWTILTLLRSITAGIKASLQSVRFFGGKNGLAPVPLRTEEDVPFSVVICLSILLLIPLSWLLKKFVLLYLPELSITLSWLVTFVGLVAVLGLGFLCAAICAYFAGLVGSSTSPISGITLIALFICSFVVLAILEPVWHHATPAVAAAEKIGATALVVMLGGLIAAISAISNDTMQDLKAGQMVGATPKKQQLMLIFGVAISSLVIPPILNLLYHAYGFTGAMPRPGMDPGQALAAPQANLIATIIQGIFSHHTEWTLLGIGGVIAALSIIIDRLLTDRFGFRFPALAVGLGVYLPLDSSMPLVIGGLLAALMQFGLKRHAKKHNCSDEAVARRKQEALLLACGLVAGSALMGVILAIPFAIKGDSDALTLVGPSFLPYAQALGIGMTLLLCRWFYQTIKTD